MLFLDSLDKVMNVSCNCKVCFVIFSVRRWSQPAQFLTPWVTHSEVTSEQWVDRWKVLAAKFSELSSGGSGGGN